MAEQERDPQLEALLEYLRDERGFDFTGYKRPSLARRIAKRVDAVGAPDFDAYRTYLEHHQDEFAQLFNTILINVTSFFRDEIAWDFVARELVPKIVDGKRETEEPIRIWSTGCASGQEAYTVAMVFAEAVGVDGASNPAFTGLLDAPPRATPRHPFQRPRGFSPPVW